MMTPRDEIEEIASPIRKYPVREIMRVATTPAERERATHRQGSRLWFIHRREIFIDDNWRAVP